VRGKLTGLPEKPVGTLAEAGIDKNLAHRGRAAGDMAGEDVYGAPSLELRQDYCPVPQRFLPSAAGQGGRERDAQNTNASFVRSLAPGETAIRTRRRPERLRLEQARDG
jgi:hypothetical protein